MRVLMCKPDYYTINYEINPWMNKTKPSHHPTAVKQWNHLYETIKKCGATIDLIMPAQNCPDMVFTANAGLWFENKIILSHFKYTQRQTEEPYFRAWFTEQGFSLLHANADTQTHFEGAGDALLAGETIFAGFGFRTDKKFYEQASYFNPANLVYCELTDPYFYHLDTCFCPINKNLAIWYPNAFTKASQKLIQAEIELIKVEPAEAKNFACNAVVLDKNIILPTGCPILTKELTQHGFNVHECEMTEYLKAGGACKCLTLMLS